MGYPTRGNPILGFVTGNDKAGEAENSPRPCQLIRNPIQPLVMLTGPVTTISPAIQTILCAI